MVRKLRENDGGKEESKREGTQGRVSGSERRE